MIKELFRKINCMTGGHKWTTATQEGIPITKAQLDNDLEGFLDYAKLYCKHCGKVSELSMRAMNKND